MSISAAPARTDSWICASFSGKGIWPAGKPVETAAGGNGGDRYPAAGQLLHRDLDEIVVDADGGRRDAEVRDSQGGQDVAPHRAHRLLAQSPHPSRRVVAGQRRQVDAADGLQQPGGLVVLLDGAAGADRRRATFDGAAVDTDAADPFGVEVRPGVSAGVPVLRLQGADVGFRCACHAGYSMRSDGGWPCS
ncbi:MAG: hypothetical protein MUE63_13730 [Xanthomonadales bacterium]|nr:hypothetical protein [Xanthomonadales bacterium]